MDALIIIPLLVTALIVTIIPCIVAYVWERNKQTKINRTEFFFRLIGVKLAFFGLDHLQDDPSMPEYAPVILLFLMAITSIFLFVFVIQRLKSMRSPVSFCFFALIPFVNFFVYLLLLISAPDDGKKREIDQAQTA